MTDSPILLAVPNVSEGGDHGVLEAVERAFAPAHFLDIHVDADHARAVYTLAGEQGELSEALLEGAREVVKRVDLNLQDGLHPHVGALDVMPVVYLDEGRRGAACAEVLTAAALIGEELELPVILYGELATRPEHAERAWLRLGGWRRLAERIEAGEVVPDFGPARAHPTAGVVLAAARPPLMAFNLDLVTDDVEVAKRIAAELRESNGGLPGVRAIGLYLADRGRAQVSTNVHDYRITPLRTMVEEVRSRAEMAEAELVGPRPGGGLRALPRGPAAARLLARAPSARGRPAGSPVTSRPWPSRRRSAAASTGARPPGRSSAPAAPGARARARTPRRSPASGARSGSTSRPPGAARSTGRRSRRSCSAC